MDQGAIVTLGLTFLLFLQLPSIYEVAAIQCYQCDSQEDESCPQWHYFDTRLNALVDCSSFEAHTPGLFCQKVYQESSGWNSWIKITRSCASRTETGVAWGCRYDFEPQGVYKETCYCQDRDGCNAASHLFNASWTATILSLCCALFSSFVLFL